MQTDVSRWEQVEELARRTFEAFGTAHVICNNAGIGCGRGGRVGDLARGLAVDDRREPVGRHSRGAGVRAAARRARRGTRGRTPARIAGLVTVPGMAPYCVTKQGVVALSECLHHDLTLKTAGKVKVSVLCPAWVKTKISESERNRPASLPRAARKEPTEQERAIEGAVRAAVAMGIPPEVVAEKVAGAQSSKSGSGSSPTRRPRRWSRADARDPRRRDSRVRRARG